MNHLSDYEMRLVADAEILLAKNRIIQKVCNLFAQLGEEYIRYGAAYLEEEAAAIPPKISKGEQYMGLPFVLLDYPRVFKKHNFFAVRTMFWWGHYFSIHLHLSGSYQLRFAKALRTAMSNGLLRDWYIGVNTDEWQHHFEPENYVQVEYEENYIFEDRRFIKLAKKIPLSEWNNVQNLLFEEYKLLFEVLHS